MSGKRLSEGGNAIDRSKPIRFTFDGTEYEGFEGDTLASALLANGMVGRFRSPILGRPRGVFTAGEEEPNAFVEVSAPWFEPIVAATMVELVDGLVASPRAGKGRLSEGTAVLPRKPSEHRSVHVELLVIGGGHEGLYPAEEAAQRGERVLLVERLPSIDEPAGTTWRPDGVRYMTRATALGLYDEGFAIVHERAAGVDRLWHIRAERVVLATGTREGHIAFADNDRPGIMLSHSGLRYLWRHGVLAGTRAVVFGVNPYAAEWLLDAGAEIAGVVDPRPQRPVGRPLEGIEVSQGWTVEGTAGPDAITQVLLRGPDGERRTVGCDLVLVAGGLTPVVDLWRAVGGTLRFDAGTGCFLPDVGPPWLSVVGSAAGEDLGAEPLPYPFVPADDLSTHFVDLQRDQTVQDVLDAVGGGLRSVEHVKRTTYIGTAIDQGRTSGVLTAEIVNAALGWELGAQDPTSARPPYVPVPFSVLAGPLGGPTLLDPVRTTPIHDEHLERGAVFENVGQWKRPRFFPIADEDMDAAVARECLAVRTGVGTLDASTLGKIDVVGPDAALFLDRMYTNRMSNLAVGSIRYGLMLGLDGMVFDDGVAMRLAEDHYLVTTTTGGAAAVLDRFEEWLQTEWPELRVYCTSVTEQWAVVAVGGPRARDLVERTGCDVDLSAASFPWMTWREGTVAGVPCRLCRVSFHGELSYELHVAAWHGRHVWDAVLDAGATPYGTEAMHVLRAEKGYVIVGQETDGTVTPDDLGMGWIVNPSKGDFVGKRSLVRADTTRPDRKQLVGLLPDDRDALLVEGCQLVAAATLPEPPVPMLGHLTSSYRSASLGRTFALAMVKAGRSRIGETIYAATAESTMPVAVTAPVLYDPNDERRDG
jgi:sarcosine oxidase, subunit alpha